MLQDTFSCQHPRYHQQLRGCTGRCRGPACAAPEPLDPTITTTRAAVAKALHGRTARPPLAPPLTHCASQAKPTHRATARSPLPTGVVCHGRRGRSGGACVVWVGPRARGVPVAHESPARRATHQHTPAPLRPPSDATAGQLYLRGVRETVHIRDNYLSSVK